MKERAKKKENDRRMENKKRIEDEKNTEDERKITVWRNIIEGQLKEWKIMGLKEREKGDYGMKGWT